MLPPFVQVLLIFMYKYYFVVKCNDFIYDFIILIYLCSYGEYLMKNRDPLKVMIGLHVKEAREAAGLTQAKLAEEIDKSTTFISSLENGTCGANIRTIISICDVLKCSSDFILFEKRHSENSSHLLQYQNLIKDLTPEEMDLIQNVVHAAVLSLKQSGHLANDKKES